MNISLPLAAIASTLMLGLTASSALAQKDNPKGELGVITLPGGDVVEDGVINILDLAFMAIHYRSSDSAADVNGDGQVDIFDLTIAASNYNQRGPVSNWE